MQGRKEDNVRFISDKLFNGFEGKVSSEMKVIGSKYIRARILWYNYFFHFRCYFSTTVLLK